MSRAFGDNAAKSVGVIADPVITEHRLTNEDKFLILASDGVFEFLSNETCVETVKHYWPTGS